LSQLRIGGLVDIRRPSTVAPVLRNSAVQDFITCCRHSCKPRLDKKRNVRGGGSDFRRSEAHDLAAQHPEKVKELVALWFEEARKYNVLPLNDLVVSELISGGWLFQEPATPSGQYTYYPGTSAVPEQSAANTHGVSFKVLADVDFTEKSQGVIFAHGSRFGGHSLFVKDKTVYYVYNFLGLPPEYRLSGPAPSSGRHIVGVEFIKEKMGEHHEVFGTAKLHVDDKEVASGALRTQMRFSLCGEGLCIGYDSGDAVLSLYKPRFDFIGGTDSQGRVRRRQRCIRRSGETSARGNRARLRRQAINKS